MFIGVSRLELHIPAARSLKEKRAVVQSISSRIRNEYRVAIAEIEALENWNLAVLGMAVVSNDAGHAREVIDHIIAHVDRMRMDAEPGAIEIDVLDAL